MTTETLTCPYCNAVLGVQAGWSAGQRIVCPRCGDAFPLRFDDSFTDRPPPPRKMSSTAITADAPSAGVRLPARWSNRLIAGVVLCVMVLMAGGGLAFMLMTQQQRRAYDTNRPPRRPGKQRGVPEADDIPLVASISPDKLTALGYLPPGVNLLLAARVPELLASPAAAQVLHAPIKLGESTFRLENLPKWLGFGLDEIDHLVFAARIDNSLIPPFYLVLRTAGPYSEEQLRQRLKGTSVPSPRKKKLFAFRAPRAKVPLNAWCADERTVVLALFADQLEPLPSRPDPDLQQLPEELRALLKQRREPTAPVWIAGHCSREWSKTSAAMFLKGMKKADLKKLEPLRTFGIFLVPAFPMPLPAEHGNENGVLVVKGVFACKDEAGARGMEEHFRKLFGPDADFETALDGSWLHVWFHTSSDLLTKWASVPLILKK